MNLDWQPVPSHAAGSHTRSASHTGQWNTATPWFGVAMLLGGLTISLLVGTVF
jgi:hypothetical protein